MNDPRLAAQLYARTMGFAYRVVHNPYRGSLMKRVMPRESLPEPIDLRDAAYEAIRNWARRDWAR